MDTNLIPDGFTVSEVVSIEDIDADITYDLNVSGIHEYIANGMVAHNCMGELHPHGDMAIFDAMVNLSQTQTHFPMIEGYGNWGDFVDRAGAPRYVECRLDKKAEYTLEYMPVAEMMPNYDGKWKEPVYLPTQIPYLLIYGCSGIAVGATTGIPSHKADNALKCVSAYMSGEKDLKKLAKLLGHPTYVYGGFMVSEDKDWRAMLKTGSGTLYSCGDYEQIKFGNANAVQMSGIPEGLKIDTMLKKASDSKFVTRVVDNSGARNKRVNYVFVLKRGVKFEDAEKHIRVMITKHIKYDWNVVITQEDIKDSRFVHVDLLKFLDMWTTYRKDVESKWLLYQIDVCNKEIWRWETVIKAYENFDKVVKCLKTDEPKAALMKQIKFTDEQAEYVLSLQLRTMTRTNVGDLHDKIKKTTATIKDLKGKRKDLTNTVINLIDKYAKDVK